MAARNLFPVILLPVWFLFTITAVLRADLRINGDSPRASLTAFASSVSVVRGGVADAVLESSQNFRNQVYFEIVERPSRGRIQGIRLTGDHSAVVTYQHDGSAADGDRFTFRVRSAARSPSPPTVCTIRVLPVPGKLRMEPPAIDFADVPLGGGCSRIVSLANEGDSDLRGGLHLPRGMAAPAGDGFRIAPGKSTRITLEFHPWECAPWKERISVMSDDGKQLGEIPVAGSGRPRLVVFPGSDDSTVRLSNSSSGQFRVNFSEPKGWKHPESVNLMPGEVKSVVFSPQQRLGRGEEAAGDMKITDGFTAIDHPLPGLPRFQPVVMKKSGQASFSECTPGDLLEVRFCLSNPMVVPKRLSLVFTSVPDGVVPEKTELLLAPNELQMFRQDWKPPAAGSNSLTLSVMEEETVSSRISWDATMRHNVPPADATSPEINAPKPDSLPPESETVGGKGFPSGNSSASGLPKRSIPGLAVAEVRPWLRSPGLLVSWNNSLAVSEAEVWRLLPRAETIDPDRFVQNGRISMGVLFDPVVQKFRFIGKPGHYSGLTMPDPGSGSHLLRIRLVCPEGDGDLESEVSVEVPSHSGRLVPLMSVLLGVSLVFFLWRRKR
jgi:hypothetical protein